MFVLVAGLADLPAAQAKPATPDALAGRWLGKVVADVGEMPIEVVLEVADGKVTGEIRTFHGALRIGRSERQADGRWKLSFTAEDGDTGTMLGAVTDDEFAGDWDFAPNAVGKFEVKRAKAR
jgi:hypothetical protein